MNVLISNVLYLDDTPKTGLKSKNKLLSTQSAEQSYYSVNLLKQSKRKTWFY